MEQYKIIGIDLAKTKFHIVALNQNLQISYKKMIKRNELMLEINQNFPKSSTFAFEACGGCHYMAQQLNENGYESIIILKPKDVKPYAKSRQKNDTNDALAICKAALDPQLRHVHPKSKEEQAITFLHKTRANTLKQRIQKSNALLSSLMEFGFDPNCKKTTFAKQCESYIQKALEEDFVTEAIYEQMIEDCKEIQALLVREKKCDEAIKASNKKSDRAQLLEKIPGIGPINASMLSTKPMESYEAAKEFAASLGLVPRQNTTGGKIQLGSITKQGDRYARTMLVQAGRSLVMRSYKPNVPQDEIYDLIKRLREKGKGFNVICVAVANKLARIAYGCIVRNKVYQASA
jgi:transposase